ncbi:hypothetical protein D3P09_02405 [Paenibacillus pinisoli]|uniref:Uncharacterized protein n=1 Tax=Paenibacillus pinisoli TaxID=1276110 RepID=A0A3A6Q015_9BACL|nr:hypothetical protein [Paenibacillus pinisoli]RJX40893.1 hypothetical protein D3P09_02405 [Paenibacillus pinisoli]
MKYSEFINIIVESDPRDWIVNDEYGTYIYKENLSVTIKREEIDFSDQGRFYEDWAERFPDKKAYRQKYFLCFHQTIVEDFYVVAVDGFRSYIPYPKLENMTITQFQYKVGSIINILSGHSFDEYLRRTKITVTN